MNTNLTSIDAGVGQRTAALRTSLNEFLKLAGDREGLEIHQMADPLDQVRSSTDRELTLQMLDRQAHSIHEIRNALERIDLGSYGSCEGCEQQLLPKRLDALPWARLCVKCQEAAEIDSGLAFSKAA